MTAVESESTTATTTIDSLSVDPRHVVAILRTAVLGLTPADLALEPRGSLSVWGVVIETAHPDAVASLVVLADGSVSLYVSDGSGCVDCGSHRDVRFAGADLLEVAAGTALHATPTDDLDYPPPGYIRAYFFGPTGLLSLQVRLEELNSVETGLGSLYFAGQRVINAIERVGAGRSIEQEIRTAQLSGDSIPVKGSPLCLSVGNAVRRLPR